MNKFGFTDKEWKETLNILKKYQQIEKVVLFGSRAMNTFKPMSDVDLVLYGEKVNHSVISSLQSDFEDSLIPYLFDIISYKTIKSDELKEHIRLYGKTIIGKENKLPSGWVETTLGEVIKTNISSIGKDFEFDEILYLDTGSITENRIEQLQSFSISEAPSRAKRLVKENDIVYSTVRPNQKHFGFIQNPQENLVVSTGFTVISAIPEKADSKFLYYFLTQDQITNNLQQIAEHSTSTYPSIRPEHIENLEISLPHLPEQQAIASVLSAFDDKIELLREQNKTLEEMGQVIFKEWFGKYGVDDFIKAQEVLEFEKGIEIGSNNYFENKNDLENPEMFYRVGDISNNGNISSLYCKKDLLKNRIFKKDDVLVSFDGTVGRVFIGGNGGYSSGIRKIYAKNGNIKNSFLYFWAKSEQTQETINLYSEGTTIQHAGKSIPYLEIISNQEYIDEITESLNPIFIKILDNLYQIQSLARSRDELLPRLMSGIVRVKL